jgi:hypothetical protein
MTPSAHNSHREFVCVMAHPMPSEKAGGQPGGQAATRPCRRNGRHMHPLPARRSVGRQQTRRHV